MPTQLYNGIELPDNWPPHMDRENREPMPVPYLRNRPDVVPIDLGRQLFVDNFLIDQSGLIRRYHQPVKFEGNPVMWPETETELGYGETVPCATPKGGGIWYDNSRGVFRMWYEAGWLGMGCYAESKDGIVWERPDLDVLDGVRAGNQVIPTQYEFDSSSAIYDPHTTDDSQRFKWFMRGPNHSAPDKRAWAFTSPDGIHWSQPIKTGTLGDRSSCHYNPFRRKWVFSLRNGGRHGRQRLYVEHDDFLTGAQWDEETPVYWTGADSLDEGNEIPPQLYNHEAVAYESLMLGIYQIFRGPENNRGAVTRDPKHTEILTAFSRDGFHWDRPDRRPFIPADRRAGSWEFGYVQPCSSICLVVGDELWFYYIGFAGDRHTELTNESQGNLGTYANGATGLAKLRRDGFASLDVGFQPASVTTRPVQFSGEELFVNVNTKGGILEAQVVEADDTPIEGFGLEDCVPYAGNSTCQRITWKNARIGSLKNRPVKLRFRLHRGSLYSFWVSPDTSGKSNGYLAGGGPGYNGIIDD